jgi:predicted amidohydrolase YtcJ
VQEAFGLHTTGAAHAAGEERIKGTLAPGMLADFVELGQDPFQVPPAGIVDIPVRSTWSGGRPVHGTG